MGIFDFFSSDYPPFPPQGFKVGQDDIDPFKGRDTTVYVHKFSAKLGCPITFDGYVHGSVGIWIETEYDKQFFTLSTQGAPKPNCGCGGDGFMKSFIFTPVRKGKTTINIKHDFRGNIVKIDSFEIKIK